VSLHLEHGAGSTKGKGEWEAVQYHLVISPTDLL